MAVLPVTVLPSASVNRCSSVISAAIASTSWRLMARTNRCATAMDDSVMFAASFSQTPIAAPPLHQPLRPLRPLAFADHLYGPQRAQRRALLPAQNVAGVVAHKINWPVSRDKCFVGARSLVLVGAGSGFVRPDPRALIERHKSPINV